MATPTYDLLDSVTLSSSATSVTFSSIDQSYRDLILVYEAKAASSSLTPRVTFNNDTATNYSHVFAIGNGSSAISGSNSAISYLYPGSGAGTTSATLYKLQVFDYSQTDKHKSCLYRSDLAIGATNMLANRWANTSAVTEIDIVGSGDNFAAGSTFYLYGVAA